MVTQTFKTALIFLFSAILFALVVYAGYCRRKAKSYKGTGRMAEIEEWLVKATISWLATFGLTLALIVSVI